MNIGIGKFLKNGLTQEGIESALRRIVAAVTAGFQIQHKEDGSHTAITADSLTLDTGDGTEGWVGNIGGSLVPNAAGIDLGQTVTTSSGTFADLPFRNIRFYGTLTYSQGFDTEVTLLGGNTFTLTQTGSAWDWTFGRNNITGYPLELTLYSGGNTHELTIGAGLVGIISNRDITGASLSTAGAATCNYVEVTDGITAPGAGTGARIYVDTADGSLKVVFASGTVKTLATDP